MARLRFDSVKGELSAAIAPTDTVISSPALVRMGAVGGGDTALVCLFVTDNGGNITASENVYVTSHAANTTSAIVTRAGDGTTALSWGVGASWAHGWGVADVADLQAQIAAKAPLASPALSGTPTAPTQAALDNSTKLATTAYVDRFSPVFNVKAYGAKGDGTTDDTAAIASAIAAASAVNGTVLFPPSATPYLFSQLVLDGTVGLTLAGTSSYVGSWLRCTATGSTTGISAHNTYDLTFQNLSITYSSATYSGILIDLYGGAATQTYVAKFIDCGVIGGESGAVLSPTLISADRVVGLSIRGRTTLQGCVNGIRGKASNGSFSQCVDISISQGGSVSGAMIYNPGDNWHIHDSVFEAYGGVGNAVNHASGVKAQGMEVDSCWFGDDTAATAWITFSGSGLEVHGNLVSLNHSGSALVKCDENSWAGIDIHGNSISVNPAGANVFQYGATTGGSGLSIGKNSYSTAMTSLVDTLPAPVGSIIVDNPWIAASNAQN